MQRSGLDRYMYDVRRSFRVSRASQSGPGERFPYNLTGAILKKVFLFLFFFFSLQALRSPSSVDERRSRVNGRQNCEKFGRCRRPQGPLWPQRFLFRTCTRSAVDWARTLNIVLRSSCFAQFSSCQVEDGRGQTDNPQYSLLRDVNCQTQRGSNIALAVVVVWSHGAERGNLWSGGIVRTFGDRNSGRRQNGSS